MKSKMAQSGLSCSVLLLEGDRASIVRSFSGNTLQSNVLHERSHWSHQVMIGLSNLNSLQTPNLNKSL